MQDLRAIVEAAKAGDGQAFDRVMAHFRTRLRGFAWSRLSAELRLRVDCNAS